MNMDFTAWLWINWIILALTLGFFWTVGVALASALLALLHRG